MGSQVYAYIRVSTREQDEARQIAALEGWEIPPENRYLDRQSGKDFARPAWRKMVRKLQAGDLVVVKSIDRLGRNYTEILEEWQRITKKKRADIVVLDMPLLDTRAREQDLTGTLIADLVLQILSYVAQAERESIRQRQDEGIAAAKARGVKFGPPIKPDPPAFVEAKKAYLEGTLSVREGAKLAGMSRSTFYRRCRPTEVSGESISREQSHVNG